MRILMLAAALRQDSLNKKLINVAAQMVKKAQHEVDLASFSEFILPLYDGDAEKAQGIPEATQHFVNRMQQVQALIISSPEYNHSIPGTLKNLIDWVSRISPMPWKNQYILLLSASPSMVGGNRGLWATRIPLEYCGSFVYPDMFSLAKAPQAFDATNHLIDEKVSSRLEKMITDFIAHVGQCRVQK
ncbi:MAG TPA: NAD(P)H-dependent oxidoreductase [Gammaproteobacteria bacterium]|nr:NAD(P)H-dependent oxidoreductase [Gammaproteobacteria bacterium]